MVIALLIEFTCSKEADSSLKCDTQFQDEKIPVEERNCIAAPNHKCHARNQFQRKQMRIYEFIQRRGLIRGFKGAYKIQAA
jgi:hypothetical protein